MDDKAGEVTVLTAGVVVELIAECGSSTVAFSAGINKLHTVVICAMQRVYIAK